MRRVVKERINGEDYFAVWSSVVMGTVTDFVREDELALILMQQGYTAAEAVAAISGAVHPDEVY